jgi:signal transduction histidine kinase
MLIRTKLVLRFTLLVAGILLAFSVFVYYFQAEGRQQRFHNRLLSKAGLVGRVLLRHRPLNYAGSELRARDLLTTAQEHISIYGPDGRMLYTSDTTAANNLFDQQYGSDKHQEDWLTTVEGRRETVLLRYPYAGQTYQIFVSSVDELGWANIDKLALVLVVGNVGALLLIILTGWLFANESLRPVARVVAQVEQINASNLSQRVDEGNQRDEIAQLAITFNQMLGRVQHAFEAQRSFLSNASHELRTPLTTLQGTLETSLAYDKALADSRQSMQSALLDVRHLIDLTNGLLTLARTDAAVLDRRPVRLDECLSQAIGYAQGKYPGREFRQTFGPLPEDDSDVFAVRGNPQLLTTALVNLLDNAAKYSAGPVVAELGYADANTLLVSVRDTGAGISAADLRLVFEPLFRAEGVAKVPGSGLGLPLTQKVIRLHGGRVELSSTEGQGTTARVWLPVA